MNVARPTDEAPACAMANDRARFVAPEDQYEEFLRLLHEPLQSTARLDDLLGRPSPFGTGFTPRPS